MDFLITFYIVGCCLSAYLYLMMLFNERDKSYRTLSANEPFGTVMSVFMIRVALMFMFILITIGSWVGVIAYYLRKGPIPN